MGRLFVAGVDDSEAATTAVVWAALNLATRPGDELHLLFALPPPAGPAAAGAAEKEEDENQARATLDRLLRHPHPRPPRRRRQRLGCGRCALVPPSFSAVPSSWGGTLFWCGTRYFKRGAAPLALAQGWASRSSPGPRRSRLPGLCWAREARARPSPTSCPWWASAR